MGFTAGLDAVDNITITDPVDNRNSIPRFVA
jgi:hypothetical protein